MSARSRRFRRSKAEAAARKADAVKSIEQGQVWVEKRKRGTRIYIFRVWETAVTVLDLRYRNQRGLSIESLLARYKKEA